MVVEQVRHTAGTTFAVATLEPGGELTDPLVAAGVEVVPLAAGARRTVVTALPPLVHLVRRFKPDVVHGHLPRAGLAAGLAAKFLRRPFVYTEHNVWSAYHPLSRPLAFGAVRLAATVVAVSDVVRRSALRWSRVAPDRVVTIRNGIDVSRLPRAEIRAGMPLRICSIGNLYRRKGHRYLLLALGNLRSRGLAVELHIFGEGPERPALAELATRLQLDAHVRFHGLVLDAPARLHEFDLFVLPSLVEGLPIALLEAMAAGLPAIASAVGGVPEVIDHGRNGLLVPPREPSAIEEAVAALVADLETRRHLSAAARQTVRERFSISAMARSYEMVYARLTELPRQTITL